MTADDFVNILVTEMEADASTALCDKLMKDARASILSGKGTIGHLTSSSLNGKSFQRNVQFSALEVMNCCRRALTMYASTDGDDDGTVSATRPDFRGFQP
jgi:hypothetical protein